MILHVFVDESRRGSTYLLAAAIIPANRLAHTRDMMRGLRVPGARRIHFKHERDTVQKDVAGAVVGAGLRMRIFTGRGKAEPTRRAALRALVRDINPLAPLRLVLDSRGEAADRLDRQLISTCVANRHFVYEHMRSHEDPALWVPDAVAWCWGAAGEWRKRVEPIIERVVTV